MAPWPAAPPSVHARARMLCLLVSPNYTPVCIRTTGGLAAPILRPPPLSGLFNEQQAPRPPCSATPFRPVQRAAGTPASVQRHPSPACSTSSRHLGLRAAPPLSGLFNEQQAPRPPCSASPLRPVQRAAGTSASVQRLPSPACSTSSRHPGLRAAPPLSGLFNEQQAPRPPCSASPLRPVQRAAGTSASVQRLPSPACSTSSRHLGLRAAPPLSGLFNEQQAPRPPCSASPLRPVQRAAGTPASVQRHPSPACSTSSRHPGLRAAPPLSGLFNEQQAPRPPCSASPLRPVQRAAGTPASVQRLPSPACSTSSRHPGLRAAPPLSGLFNEQQAPRPPCSATPLRPVQRAAGTSASVQRLPSPACSTSSRHLGLRAAPPLSGLFNEQQAPRPPCSATPLRPVQRAAGTPASVQRHPSPACSTSSRHPGQPWRPSPSSAG